MRSPVRVPRVEWRHCQLQCRSSAIEARWAMKIAQKVLIALTLVSAGIAALLYPVMPFAIRGLGTIDLEAAVFLLTLYLLHPVALMSIFFSPFDKIAAGRFAHVATGFIVLNALWQFAVAPSSRRTSSWGTQLSRSCLQFPRISTCLTSSWVACRGPNRQGNVICHEPDCTSLSALMEGDTINSSQITCGTAYKMRG